LEDLKLQQKQIVLYSYILVKILMLEKNLRKKLKHIS